MEQSLNKFSGDFLKKDELRTPKEEIDVRLVLEQYHAASQSKINIYMGNMGKYKI